MLKDVIWAENLRYRPRSKHTPIEFFTKGLLNSKEFDLHLGYFNSAAISVLSKGFATFIARGGKMRLVINHIVSEKDRRAFDDAYSDEELDYYDLTNITHLAHILDEYGMHFFKCLSFMIRKKRIEIRIVRPKGPTGIEHPKEGQFRDNEDTVSFVGSANFTLGGLINNSETITVSLSSSPDTGVVNGIKTQKDEFDRLMAGEDEDKEYLNVDDLEVAIKKQFGNPDIEELLDVERKLRLYKKYADEAREEEYNTISLPEFPYSSGPREYQNQAFVNWVKNNQKGLFVMATGTGKTITSLNCLLQIYKQCQYYKALILVPTVTLVDQWYKECKKFKFSNIVCVCSSNPEWRNELDSIKLMEDLKDGDSEPSYIVIATYASFGRKNIFSSLLEFPKRQLLMIADEAHNLGAGTMLKRLEDIPYLRRIGLSATPERQYDDNANAKLNKFFGSEEQHTYEYSMKEAIENGVLCKYYYFPHVVELTSDEMSEYIKISQKLAKMYNFSKNEFDQSNDQLKMLLLKRKRIIHKAQNKERVFEEILKALYDERGNLKYTLIYVPEGNTPDDNNSDILDRADTIQDDKISQHIINRYTEIVKNISPVTTVKQFVSNSQDRAQILEDFAAGKLEVLTSMKCLDEGVDVPRSEIAIFCSSTGNPRQFIQRRGRILRTHPDKHIAIIHDLIVAPFIGQGDETYYLERKLIEGEFKRVRDFANLSRNADDAYRELDDIANYYKLSIL